MLTLPSNVKLYLATAPTDCRKSFDGLSTLVQDSFGLTATTGDLFIFLNRRGTQVRILFWDRDGFCVLVKKLEAGTFRRVKTLEGAPRVEIDARRARDVARGHRRAEGSTAETVRSAPAT